jgi:hypothetical protein
MLVKLLTVRRLHSVIFWTMATSDDDDYVMKWLREHRRYDLAEVRQVLEGLKWSVLLNWAGTFLLFESNLECRYILF